jgi:hypothetical protein
VASLLDIGDDLFSVWNQTVNGGVVAPSQQRRARDVLVPPAPQIERDAAKSRLVRVYGRTSSGSSKV